MTTSMHHRRRETVLACCAGLVLFLILGCEASQSTDGETAPSWYVSAQADPGGDGSRDRPFETLADAEAASAPGDTIYVVAGTTPLDGGISLQEDQRLLGWGPEGEGSARATLTRSAGGAVVTLSAGNEVAHLRIADLRGHAIEGTRGSSGAHIHHVEIARAIAPETDAEDVSLGVPGGIRWAVRLEASGNGDGDQVRIADCSVLGGDPEGGDALGGIQIHHRGESSGSYLIERCAFSHLGGRAVHLLTEDASRIEATIRESSADNIGLGDRNSDSILPHLRDRSQQTVRVESYRYDNTLQVGSPSNTGLEAFLEGAPFPAQDNWCDGCRLELHIEDSVFENPVTDGIQLIDFGSNSQLDAVIRRSRILNAKPQQVGGGISLLSQNADNTGNRSSLLVEDTEIAGSSRFGVAISDEGEGFTSTVDLGGGALGSAGRNRITGSAEGELSVINATPVAKHNWWGGSEPRVVLSGEGSSAETEPALDADPAEGEAP